jgi:3-hydroxybutyryl-CoA dehydrogenase
MAILVDLNDGILERARRQINENLRLQAIFKKGVAAPNVKAVLDKITFSPDCRILEKADFLIENVTEKEALYESFSDSKYRPCPLLRKMVDAGLYGRKSGAGFYPY